MAFLGQNPPHHHSWKAFGAGRLALSPYTGIILQDMEFPSSENSWVHRDLRCNHREDSALGNIILSLNILISSWWFCSLCHCGLTPVSLPSPTQSWHTSCCATNTHSLQVPSEIRLGSFQSTIHSSLNNIDLALIILPKVI